MRTGILAMRNLALSEQYDLWSVNTDQEYHAAFASQGD